ncbi:hypothetical protein AMECASPLE_031774 [Ameca splendens]|uniref:Uncharacterized protein n=1 Tax=Ameca splendens TaxID=208324 RepID=A0ABV1A2T2_9TELE
MVLERFACLYPWRERHLAAGWLILPCSSTGGGGVGGDSGNPDDGSPGVPVLWEAFGCLWLGSPPYLSRVQKGRLNLGVQVDLPHALVPTFSDVGVQEDTPCVPVPKLLRGFHRASLLSFKVSALPPLASKLPASLLLASRPLCIHGDESRINQLKQRGPSGSTVSFGKKNTYIVWSALT